MKKLLSVTLILLAFTLLVFSSPATAGDKATKEECVSMCKKAAAMVKEKGLEATLKAINDPHGPFVWKDTYVFALSTADGKTLAHPFKPGLIGKNLMGVKDINGVMLFAEFLKIGKSKAGEGWVEYMWPKPGEKKPSKKVTYIYKVPGQEVSFGAGVYID